LLAAGAADAGGPVRRRPERRLGAVDHGEHVQPGADVLHRAVRPADPVLLLLLHLHPVPPRGSRRQHDALRRLQPGDPCGRPTAEYLQYVISRITSAGSIYLAIVAMIPMIAFKLMGVSTNIPFGGVSLLILVSVGLDTVKQIDSQL